MAQLDHMELNLEGIVTLLLTAIWKSLPTNAPTPGTKNK